MLSIIIDAITYTLVVDHTILSFILSVKMNLKFYIRSNMYKIRYYMLINWINGILEDTGSKPLISSNNILVYIL